MSKILYYNKPTGKYASHGTEMRLDTPLTGIKKGDTISISGGHYAGNHEVKEISTAKATGAMWLFIDKPFKDIGIQNSLGVPIDRTTGGTVSIVANGEDMSPTLKYAIFGLVGLIIVTVIIVVIKKKKG